MEVCSLPPVQKTYQKFIVYESKQRMVVIACTNDALNFRAIEFDRTHPCDLLWTCSDEAMTEGEIDVYMNKLRGKEEPQAKSYKKTLQQVATAFGIVGFVRFMEGYYIILITKRKCVAQLGSHLIYKIESTQMRYIPHQTVRIPHPEETSYLKLFQSVDMSSNFYLSYTYDLTNSLQSQMRNYPGPPPRMCSKFIWNLGLLKRVVQLEQIQGKELRKACPSWLVFIVHGYIGQYNISVFGRSIYLTLIARRSCRYAGTRFQKRGANDDGSVANEVELEQVVHNSMTTAHDSGEFTSYLQHRGSVPAYWSQDTAGMQPKPQIVIDLGDPFTIPAGRHFCALLQRFGSPIILLNLVKKREHRARESLLTKELLHAVKYLNQFLPAEHQIKYIHKDMSRITKRKEENLMAILEKISENVIKETGFFHSGPQLHCFNIRRHRKFNQTGGMGYQPGFVGRSQTGVLRVNCVDCLDRTNTAQFIVGKTVLGQQLYALGVIDSPYLPFDSDVMCLLEEAYETLGDILALQYGGSQLVHRIRSYRKVSSPVTSQAGDVYQTIQRYYCNFFSDKEKQSAINLFLGIYSPREGHTHSWDLPTDYYLHHPLCSSSARPTVDFFFYRKWWNEKIFQSLPLPYREVSLEETDEPDIKKFVEFESSSDEDSFYEYYKPFELTDMDKMFSSIIEGIEEYKPGDVENPSPFVQRVTTSLSKSKSKRFAPVGSPQPLYDQDTSSSSDVSSDEDIWQLEDQPTPSKKKNLQARPDHWLPSCQDTYGFTLTAPKEGDLELYKKSDYVFRRSCQKVRYKLTGTRCLKEQAMWVLGRYFATDDCFSVTLPVVSKEDINIYNKIANHTCL